MSWYRAEISSSILFQLTAVFPPDYLEARLYALSSKSGSKKSSSSSLSSTVDRSEVIVDEDMSKPFSLAMESCYVVFIVSDGIWSR